MKKQLKIWTITMVALMCTLFLSACTSSTSGNSSTSSSSASRSSEPSSSEPSSSEPSSSEPSSSEPSSSEPSSSESSSSDSSSSESDQAVEPEKSMDVKIAKVTGVAESTLSLTLYASIDSAGGEPITDAASIELSNYVETTETEEYTLAAETVVKECSNETVSDIEPSEIAEGDMLAVYTDENGVEVVMVYRDEAPKEI